MAKGVWSILDDGIMSLNDLDLENCVPEASNLATLKNFTTRARTLLENCVVGGAKRRIRPPLWADPPDGSARVGDGSA